MVSGFNVHVNENFAVSVYIKNVIISVLDSYVYLMHRSNSLRLFKKVLISSSPCVHIKKISSMCLSHSKDFNCCVSRKPASNLSMKRLTYGGVNLVAITVPETCCLNLLLNLKKLFLSINPVIATKSFVGIDFLSCLSESSKSESWDILGYFVYGVFCL